MAGHDATQRFVRFGVFEFDVATGDLSRAGRKIRLQEQPRQLLAALVRRPGEVVTREELRSVLWPDDTFVDFDIGLNVVINKVRHALGDSASSPRFVETLPRRGYRFVAPVTELVSDTSEPPTPRLWRRVFPAAAAVMLLASALWVASASRAERLASPPDASTHSLAVLPLENLSGDAANDYFTDGITDALITDLASIRSLSVIARQTTKQYKGSTKSVATIAKELGVDAVIEGSVTRTGFRIRLIVQLIDGRTERHLWARTYEQDLRDILQLQREAALTVATEIGATLTPRERERLLSARPVNPAAHDAYLRGQYILGGRAATEVTASQALAEFQRAIDLDPTFAPALVGIGEAHFVRSCFLLGDRAPLEARVSAFRAARRALELDPNLGEAHGTIARLQFAELDRAGADRSFARMLALAPGYTAGLTWYAYHLISQRRHDDALEAVKRAEALDPLNLNVRVTVGLVHALRREYEKAVSIYEQILALDPGHLNARSLLITSASQLGRYDKAIAQANAAVEHLGRIPLTVARLAYAQGRAGNRAAAGRLIAELLEMARRQYVAPGHMAFAYAALGDRDHAFEWFERAYDERSNVMMLYDFEPMFDWPDDPRYIRLVAKIRQPHAVRTSPSH